VSFVTAQAGGGRTVLSLNLTEHHRPPTESDGFDEHANTPLGTSLPEKFAVIISNSSDYI
jgi:hypothetical protein